MKNCSSMVWSVAKEDAMTEIKKWDDNPRFSGGRDRLYNHIAKEKVGITRNILRDYILHSEAHQLTRPKPPMIHRAIIVKRPGAQAQADLIGPLDDPGLNGNNFLTFVDLFSKWAAARPLR